MIFSVLCTSATPAEQWQAELLEHSWGEVKQPGELVRLVAAGPRGPAENPSRSENWEEARDVTPEGCRRSGATSRTYGAADGASFAICSREGVSGRASSNQMPVHRVARVIRTMQWSPHPFTGDHYPPYNIAGSVLQWLLTEKIDGSVLLLQPNMVFRRAVAEEVEPGHAIANHWATMPGGGALPFGLGPMLPTLGQLCANQDLELAKVDYPLLIHSSDLRKIAGRWLELTGLIRDESERHSVARPGNADRLAYNISSAEFRISHQTKPLAMDVTGKGDEAPLCHYQTAVESEDGEIIWSKEDYRPWQETEANRAAPGAARELLELIEDLSQRRALAEESADLRPQRQPDVRQARLPDRMLLEIPGQAEPVALNPTAAAVWGLCDGQKTLIEVAAELERRANVAPGAMQHNVTNIGEELERIGAIGFETVPSGDPKKPHDPEGASR